jgi:hypothetical protein
MQASPLTLRRLRQLAQERRAGARSDAGIDANSAWRGSRGMLRAASSHAALAPLSTDDGCWTLHFVEADGAWRAILQLAPQAPFAAGLLAARRQRPAYPEWTHRRRRRVRGRLALRGGAGRPSAGAWRRIHRDARLSNRLSNRLSKRLSNQ